jgi:hypothetical protein
VAHELEAGLGVGDFQARRDPRAEAAVGLGDLFLGQLEAGFGHADLVVGRAQRIQGQAQLGARQDGRGIKLITCDMNPNSYGFHLADSSYTVPGGQDPDYIKKMLEICKKEKPDLLVSGVDKC